VAVLHLAERNPKHERQISYCPQETLTAFLNIVAIAKKYGPTLPNLVTPHQMFTLSEYFRH
jgi:hypothetical protein